MRASTLREPDKRTPEPLPRPGTSEASTTGATDTCANGTLKPTQSLSNCSLIASVEIRILLTTPPAHLPSSSSPAAYAGTCVRESECVCARACVCVHAYL